MYARTRKLESSTCVPALQLSGMKRLSDLISIADAAGPGQASQQIQAAPAANS